MLMTDELDPQITKQIKNIIMTIQQVIEFEQINHINQGVSIGGLRTMIRVAATIFSRK